MDRLYGWPDVWNLVNRRKLVLQVIDRFDMMMRARQRLRPCRTLTTHLPVLEVRLMADSQPITTRSQRQNREDNPNWRGGRSIASNGYIIVRVGVGHHLADVRGYAYEHRLVAEQKLG